MLMKVLERIMILFGCLVSQEKMSDQWSQLVWQILPQLWALRELEFFSPRVRELFNQMAGVYEIDYEPGMVLDNRDLPFTYTRVGNAVQVKRNLEFLERKKEQCFKHLEFMLKVITLEHLSRYIQTYATLYTAQIEEMNKHYQECQITVGPKISQLEQQLTTSNHQLLKSRTENAQQVTLQKLKQSTIKRALSKSELQGELEKIAKENAEREAGVQKHENIVGSYQSIVGYLKAFQEDLNGRYRTKIDELNFMYGANKNRFDSLHSYLEEVKKQEAIIYSQSCQQEFIVAIEAHLSKICADFEQLKAQVEDSQKELHSIKFAHEVVQVWEDVVRKRIEIAEEEALQPARIFDLNINITKYKEQNQRLLILKSRDRGGHLQHVTQVTQENMKATQRCLLQLDVISSETTDQFVIGLTRDDSQTTAFTYIDRIKIKRDHPKMQLVDPKEIPFQEDTKKQVEIVNQIEKEIKKIKDELQHLTKLKLQLAELQSKIPTRQEQFYSEQQVLAKALQQRVENFKHFVEKAGLQIQEQYVSQFAISAVMGAITQTLVMQPESCMGDGQEKQHLYLQVSHSWFMRKAAQQASELNPHPPRACASMPCFPFCFCCCCVPSNSSLVFGLTQYPLSKAVDLILHHELIGAIRGDDGGMQKIERRIRTCNIDRHLAPFIRTLCEVGLRDFMVARRIDEESARRYLRKYDEMFQDTKRGNLHTKMLAV